MQNTVFQNKGFTLIELIIVISIIAVLAALAFMALSGETAQARDSKRVSDLKTFEDAIATTNGKNKQLPIDILAQPSITTNTGVIYPLRGSKFVEITSSLFDSDVIPTIPRDPKGSKYLGAFLSNTDYELFGTKENPDTKTPTAIVRGSFKIGAIIDILINDTDDTRGVDQFIEVANPSRFIAGDIIRVDAEYFVVTGVNASTGRLYVYRNDNLPNNGATPNSVRVHNKGSAVKLHLAAPGAGSLLCLASTLPASNGVAAVKTLATDGAGAISEGVINTIAVTSAGLGASSYGSICSDETKLISDSGVNLPYSVSVN